ncbi:MAG: hypothetical protein Q4A17_08385 [Thermoguttaceae bacterium]|nr:hypothetical protein [Thermoguttaceae bacterium]
MIGLLTLIGIGVLAGMCSSDSDDVQVIRQVTHFKQCRRCGRMVKRNSFGTYHCCGRHWR